MSKITIDQLKKFCAEDGTRYQIEKPFSRGDYTYATDGHIAIRIPRDNEIPETKAPDVEKLFNEALARKNYQWVEVPEVKLSAVECDICDGKGSFDERTICEDCNGTGEQWLREAIRFSVNDKEIGLANVYVALIRELPKAEIGLVEAAAISWTSRSGKQPSGTPVMFRFNGGDGLLLPMRL